VRAAIAVLALCAVRCVPVVEYLGGRTGIQITPAEQLPAGCGLEHAAFCDTFDTPSPGGRGGDLDDAQWSTARISTDGQGGVYQQWKDATESACGATTSGIKPGRDLSICAGGITTSSHLNDTEEDGSGYTLHSYRPRKPFDFTNRTGVIVFDIGAKAQVPGGHGFWFNLVISEEPVPAPYEESGAIALFGKNAVVLEFLAGGGSIECKPTAPRMACRRC